MEDRLLVTASPHIRDHSTTRGLMGNVVIAPVYYKHLTQTTNNYV
mgnify:CR=1 FL=1